MMNLESPNEGRVFIYVMNRNRQMRGYDEPESPSEAACCRYNEPESPNEGACLRHDEPESPSEGACLRCIAGLVH